MSEYMSEAGEVIMRYAKSAALINSDRYSMLNPSVSPGV